jgi:arabinan endo-1,5-alpha-L-arabinosidase
MLCPIPARKLLVLFAVLASATVWTDSLPAQTGNVSPVHDPVIIKQGEHYYVFSTGRGIPIRRSGDLRHWEMVGTIFDTLPDWAPAAVPGVRNHIWAPDVSFFNDRYHVYYSLSTFGRNTSAIGLVTNVTLDSADPRYRWVDHGPVIQSASGDNHNAIDANVVFDEAGTPWISWGSFWSGIKMRRLDPATGMVSREDTATYSLAARPREHAIEAPHIIRHGDYYYLFVSFDRCCRRAESTYRIVVGRSSAVTGPYVDMYGVPMMEGAGTPVLSGAGRIRGPGHNSVLIEGDRQYLVHHFYDLEDNGAHKLQIRPITWSQDGWPFAGEPLTLPE